jgi:hypothetical protein
MIFLQIVELLHLIEFIKLLSDNSIKKIIKYINKSYDWMYNHFPNAFYYYFNIGQFIRAHLDPIIDTPLFHCAIGLDIFYYLS